MKNIVDKYQINNLKIKDQSVSIHPDLHVIPYIVSLHFICYIKLLQKNITLVICFWLCQNKEKLMTYKWRNFIAVLQ